MSTNIDFKNSRNYHR